MARVFVSHARRDRELADEVFGWLSTERHELFYDQDLRAGLTTGEPWQEKLFERLRWADAVVCVVTSAYLASTWCSAEVGIAVSRGSRMLPVLVEPGIRHPLMDGIQFADYSVDRDGARSLVSESLRRLDSGGGGSRRWEDGSPFPGLVAFDREMSRVFFGRRAEVDRLAALLRSPGERSDGGMIVVTGPSGCGKSSLVRAGLVPAMADEPGWWTLPVVRPGVDPIGTLSVELTREAGRLGLSWRLPDVRSALEGRRVARLVDELLLAATPHGAPPRRMLIVIDQFEELLGLVGPADQASFADVLSDAMVGSATLVATLRPEFLAPLLANPDLGVLRPRSFLVHPLDREMLGEVIRGPAELAGLTVNPELVARLVGDTGSGEALPLLAFTLKELADSSGAAELSATYYDELGGVRGALTKQANEALGHAATASGRTPADVIAGLLRLVSVDEQGTPVRIRVPLDELSDDGRAELAEFTARRLLTTDTENGRAVIGVAHEAFLTAWPPLAEAIQKHGSALLSRRKVETAATEWDAENRPKDQLWERGQLASALASLNEPVQEDSQQPGPSRQPRAITSAASPRRGKPGRQSRAGFKDSLSERAHDFLHASIRTDRRRRTRATSVLTFLLVAALIGVAVAIVQRQETEDQKVAATARQLLAQSDSIQGTDARTAVALGLAANELHPTTDADTTLFQLLVGSQIDATLIGHTAVVESVAYRPDGHVMASAGDDMTVILWDITNANGPSILAHLLSGAGAVFSVAFSSDGHTLAVGSVEGTVMLWDVTDPSRPSTIGKALRGHADSVMSVAFSPDGFTLASGSVDQTVILWDLASHVGHPLPSQTGPVSSLAFSPNGHILAIGSLDKSVVLWDLVGSARIGDPLTGHVGQVTSVMFSPDGHILATGGDDGWAMLWDVTDPGRPTAIGSPLTGNPGWSDGKVVAFSPDGHTVASGSVDNQVTIWNITVPSEPVLLQSLTGQIDFSVSAMAFSPDGHTLATGAFDNTVVLWDLTDRTRPGRIGDPFTGASRLAFTAQGQTLATDSPDNRVVLWDLTDPTQPARVGDPLAGLDDQMSSLAFSPDGDILAAGGDVDNPLILWDVREARHRELSRLTGRSGFMAIAFSPDGHTLATDGVDNTVVLWDLTDPARPSPIGDPLSGHTAEVTSVAFSPDGHTLAVGSLDNTATLWNVTDPNRPTEIGDPLYHKSAALASVTSVAFSPDGRTLAAGNMNRTVTLWNVAEPTRPTRIGDPLASTETGAVLSVVFSQDGHTMATGTEEAMSILWDVTDPTRATPMGEPLQGDFGSVGSMAFSPDGRTFAAGGGGTIVWNLTGIHDLRAHLKQRACAYAGHGLTPQEWARYIPDIPYRDACVS